MRHGFLLIDKPLGPTSHDAVGMVRRALAERSIGHLGTLDPAASGLLVLAVGAKALKVVELFKDLTKEYEAEVTFGAVSTTYDKEGVIEEVTQKPGWTVPLLLAIRDAIEAKFLGRIFQVPPAYSAVKIGGERAYKSAREGKDVVMPEREVHIHSCTILSYEYPKLLLRVACGSGTYIRSLAHDLGIAVRSGGYLSALRRTKVGEWSGDNACAPADAKWTRVMPLKEVLASFPRLDLTDEEFVNVGHGRDLPRSIKEQTIGWHGDLPVCVLVPTEDGKTHARKVL